MHNLPRRYEAEDSQRAQVYAVWGTVVTSRRPATYSFSNPRGCLDWNDKIPLKYEYVLNFAETPNASDAFGNGILGNQVLG